MALAEPGVELPRGASRKTKALWEICQRFDELFQHPCSQPLSDDWISQYEQVPPCPCCRRGPRQPGRPRPRPQPSPVQLEALAAPG